MHRHDCVVCSGTGDQLKLLARQPDTLVTINAGLSPATSLFIDSPGSPRTISVRPEELVTLTSDKPILVAQFIKGLVSGTGAPGRSRDGQE